MEKTDNESRLSFLKRVTNLYSDKLIGAQQWASNVLGEEYTDAYSDEYVRRAVTFFKIFLEKTEEKDMENVTSKQILNEIKRAQEELIKERKRLQTVNSEYSANVRGQARFEMFNERIEEAIEALTPITFDKNKINYITQDSVGVLCIADAHNGVEINMKSLFGESVNVYNPGILKARLNMLLNQVVADRERFADYGKLVVFDLGDAIQNMLRMSDLTKLKTGVIESTLDYAEMISCWLNKLNEELKVPIEYVCLGGNHMELRLLEEKKNFEEENLGRVVREFVALRLKDNPNITIDPYEEYGFKTIQGINILAIHGEDSKADLQEISFWEEYHNISIDILLMGHVHHGEQNTVGYGLTGNKEVIKIPSLVGVDTFSKKCRKMARAGAKFMLFEDGSKTWEKNYVLN